MTKTTKILLIVAIGSFAFGFTGIFWGIGKPIGAILLGLFLISKMLENESAKFDEEQALRLTQAERAGQSVKNPAAEQKGARLTPASAHAR